MFKNKITNFKYNYFYVNNLVIFLFVTFYRLPFKSTYYSLIIYQTFKITPFLPLLLKTLYLFLKKKKNTVDGNSSLLNLFENFFFL